MVEEEEEEEVLECNLGWPNINWKQKSNVTEQATTAAPPLSSELSFTVQLPEDKAALLEKLLMYPKLKDRKTRPPLKTACSLLYMKNEEPYHLPGTPALLRLFWYQVQGIAHIKVMLVKYGKAALLDYMGLGKTLQSLCGLEAALNSSNSAKPRKPSLIVVPSGTVGEFWIKEGLLVSKNFKFLAVGDAYGRQHAHHTQRVQYKTLDNFVCQGAGNDPFLMVICTVSTVHKLAKEEFAASAFHALIVDEMQSLRMWTSSATFDALDTFQAKWRIGLSATPMTNGLRDIKGFLGFFRDREIEPSAMWSDVARYGSDPFRNTHLSKYQTLPEVWKRFVDTADLEIQEMALQKLTQAMPFVISRNLDTTNDDRTTTIGANVPKLHLSRQTVGFGQEDAYNAYTAGFNRLLDDLWIEAEGRKYMQLQTLTNMATMTLSSFAAELPADQKLIQSLIAERAELSAVLHAVQDKAMSNDEALERIRSPKLSWLAVFIGRFVVERGEKCLALRPQQQRATCRSRLFGYPWRQLCRSLLFGVESQRVHGNG
ncbi:P-loop containing nucleoside triphosphate hydrolase protein [Phyllosticta capitalensis]